MSSEVYQIRDEWSMAYVGDTPWHTLGQELEYDAPLEVWAEKAHLDWEIEEVPVGYWDPSNGNAFAIPDRKALMRGDNKNYLSMVSNRYKVVQPKEILDFFKSLIDTGDFRMKTAGSLLGGRRLWALAEIGKSAKIFGQDRIDGYLLLATSCDGSLANTGMFTTVRVVCNNTLQMSIHEGEGGRSRRYIKIPHSRKFNPDEMKNELGLGEYAFEKFIEKAGEMAKYRLNDKDALELFTGLFTKEDEEGKYVTEVGKNTLKKIWGVYKGGRGQDLRSAKDTLWGAVNAITRYVDHERGYKSRDTNLNNAWMGGGFFLKEKIWNSAEELIKKAA
ncbi:MAG: DUF932 domain-containing protein [Syntrophales bacterium]|nr:DUF932 domain-containing protein [Syntrophales bacterium]